MKTIATFAALTLAVLPAFAADDPKAKVVAFNASVKVEVDAAGKPVKVEAPADLPQAIRGFIEKRVASWQYAPAKQNGVPASAVTYVEVGACAIPTAAGDGFRLALDFKGNGPGTVDLYPRRANGMPVLMYPHELQRRGIEASYETILTVQRDGKATVESLKPLAAPKTKGAAGDFEAAIRQWSKAIRFNPEMVAGVPVATRVSVPVDFTLRNLPSLAEWKRERQEAALQTSECRLAGAPAPEMESVALDSPVKVTPFPAG